MWRFGWRETAGTSPSSMTQRACSNWPRPLRKKRRWDPEFAASRPTSRRCRRNSSLVAFGVVVCHNVLEYVSHPDRALTFVAGLLRPGGIVSIMVRNRFGEAVKAAVAAGDLDRAERALSAESMIEPLYGEPARLFDRTSLAERLSRAGVSIVAERGVRVPVRLSAGVGSRDTGWLRPGPGLRAHTGRNARARRHGSLYPGAGRAYGEPLVCRLTSRRRVLRERSGRGRSGWRCCGGCP